ncbi:MAG: hypothetical protein KGI08_05450 [Thaumarchaeota archaeon]|nr:hypothetical protein [Nitrososphaerota archaeon]
MSAEVVIPEVDIPSTPLGGQSIIGAPRTGEILPPTQDTLPAQQNSNLFNGGLGQSILGGLKNIYNDIVDEFAPKPQPQSNNGALQPSNFSSEPNTGAVDSASSSRYMNPARSSSGLATATLKTVGITAAAGGAATVAGIGLSSLGTGLSNTGIGLQNLGQGIQQGGNSAAKGVTGFFGQFDSTLGLPKGSSMWIAIGIVVLIIILLVAK